MTRKAATALLATCLCATGALAAAPERLPVQAFATRPLIEDALLSPNGELMAARLAVEGKPVLAIFNLVDRTRQTRLVKIGEHRIRWFEWAGSDRVLISLWMKATLEGYDTYVTRLVTYEVSTGKATYVGYTSQGLVGDDVIYKAEDGSYVLLSLARAAYFYPDVYRCDLATGKLTRVVDAREPIYFWIADSKGEVRGAMGFEGEHIRVFSRVEGRDYYRHVGAVRLDDPAAEIDTLQIPAAGDKGLVVTNEPNGRFGLYEFDWKTGDIGNPIFEHPTVDLDTFSMTRDGRVEAVSYIDDRSRVQWFDPEMKKIQDEVDAALVGRMNFVVSTSTDRTRALVWTGTATDPAHYYYYNRPAGQLTRIASTYEALKGKQLSPVTYVSYKARDGLEIPAYLTLPAGRDPKNLPLVMLPHGGPHTRDEWGFDWLAQFLANRGYAVLQPNFRGSSGYGHEFLEKGFGQWGTGMQDDLTDGLRWLVSEGKVDPKRVCIAGASYGGYAALMGAIQSPELYRCAISWAGVTDVPEMMRYDKSQLLPARYRAWRNRVRGKDRADLKDVSPVNRAREIAIPVLLMHGTDDDNVPYRHAEIFVKAMARAGKPLEFIEFKDVGHQIEDTEDRIRFLAAIDAFLAKHNPSE